MDQRFRALPSRRTRATIRATSIRTMPLLDLTSAAQDYLKLIWIGAERGAAPVTVGGLAKSLGISASTASQGVKKLAEAGLVIHVRYGHVELTPAGRKQAVLLVRRHRLLETFLVEMLGYGWDDAHDEADVLEHAASETLTGRIDRLLGQPGRNPHGDRIPSADSAADQCEELLLSVCRGRHPA